LGLQNRDKGPLKRFWKIQKMRAKKDIAEEKCKRMATGGGKEPPAVDSFTERVSTMIPSQIKPLVNLYDDDAEMNEDFGYSKTVDNSTTWRGSSQTMSVASGPIGTAETEPGPSSSSSAVLTGHSSCTSVVTREFSLKPSYSLSTTSSKMSSGLTSKKPKAYSEAAVMKDGVTSAT
jgi:hypothetical protein